MKRLICFICFAIAPLLSRADEGMWLVQQLRPIYAKMQSCGLQLSVDQIYNESAPALSSAVVAIDGGVGTGSFISPKGLLVTNHHVAYSDIASVSTPAKNYLAQGFWARSAADEIPIKGKTVSVLRRVVDVTEEALALRHRMEREGRWGVMSMRRLYADLEKRYARTTDLTPSCATMWNGLRYYMYFYEVYRDVRLVAAPPESLGAFGGEYDNWQWPQHKGDFALYRVYADPEGHPADYAPENQPLSPPATLPIATQGIAEGDFAMVIGYPGRTHRYASSFAIDDRMSLKNPIVTQMRHRRMDLLREAMSRNDSIRLAYSDAYFSLSNFADLVRWESACIDRYRVADLVRREEQNLAVWIASDSERNARYGHVLTDLRKTYAARRTAERDLNYLRETWLGPSQALITANRVASSLARLARQHEDTLRASSPAAEGLSLFARRLDANYDRATDRALFVALGSEFLNHVPRALWGEDLARMYDAAGGNAAQFLGDAFDRSFCRDAAAMRAFLATDHATAEVALDPLVRMTRSVSVPRFTSAVNRAECITGRTLHDLETDYTHVLYAFRTAHNHPQYPNANSTMRLSYGRVTGLSPRDGVHYAAQSTTRGFAEKYDPARHEYALDTAFLGCIRKADWGRWCNPESGEMFVNFLTDNDITGGNSGSPVLDAAGRLIGLAFDGNRESMACDVYFEPNLSRTVVVDIRFVMWCLEHYGGVDYLLREMSFE